MIKYKVSYIFRLKFWARRREFIKEKSKKLFFSRLRGFLVFAFKIPSSGECCSETWDYQTTSLSALKVRETRIVDFVCLFTRAAWRVLNYAKWLRWNGGGGGGGGGAKRWHVEEMHLEAKPRYRYFASFFSFRGSGGYLMLFSPLCAVQADIRQISGGRFLGFASWLITAARWAWWLQSPSSLRGENLMLFAKKLLAKFMSKIVNIRILCLSQKLIRGKIHSNNEYFPMTFT